MNDFFATQLSFAKIANNIEEDALFGLQGDRQKVYHFHYLPVLDIN